MCLSVVQAFGEKALLQAEAKLQVTHKKHIDKKYIDKKYIDKKYIDKKHTDNPRGG